MSSTKRSMVLLAAPDAPCDNAGRQALSDMANTGRSRVQPVSLSMEMPEAKLVAELSSALKRQASIRMPVPRLSALHSQITDGLGQVQTTLPTYPHCWRRISKPVRLRLRMRRVGRVVIGSERRGHDDGVNRRLPKGNALPYLINL